ncbi:MAG: SURF1 family protein [Actinomycetota bacterium]
MVPAAPDWSFARRPFWLFSHVFAATVVVSFVALGLWQLARHNERSEFNDVVGERSAPPALTVGEAFDRPDDQIDYQLVRVTGSVINDDLVRVANRSQGGVAGQHVVAVLTLDDGRTLLVNRGFVPIGSDEDLRPMPAGPITLVGWLRDSVAKGWLGATDAGTGEVVPRLDVAAIATRLDGATGDADAPLSHWLLLADDETQLANGGTPTSDSALASFPDPVPLPPLNGGPHLSYMGQWFIFATLGAGFYLALLRRNARGGSKVTAQPVEVAEG